MPSIPWLVLQDNRKVLGIIEYVELLHCNVKLKCSARKVTVKKVACKFGCPRQLNSWCVNSVVNDLQRSFENEHWTETGPRSDSNNKES